MMRKQILIVVVFMIIPVTLCDAGMIGDAYDLSIERLPDLPRIDSIDVLFGQEPGFIGLTPTFQMILTRDADDPQLEVPLVTIATGEGEQREFAVSVDFSAMIVTLPQLGFPLADFVTGTRIWFEDLESVDATGVPEPGFSIGNVLLMGSEGLDGLVEMGDPLRFADGNGGVPPFTADTDGTGFGEGLLLTLPTGAAIVNYPVIRIEFDLIPEPTILGVMLVGGLILLARAGHASVREC